MDLETFIVKTGTEMFRFSVDTFGLKKGRGICVILNEKSSHSHGGVDRGVPFVKVSLEPYSRQRKVLHQELKSIASDPFIGSEGFLSHESHAILTLAHNVAHTIQRFSIEVSPLEYGVLVPSELEMIKPHGTGWQQIYKTIKQRFFV